VRDERINVLTVVANESYEHYVAQLQSEIEEEYGKDGLPPKPPNARQRKVASLRKEYVLKPEFKNLWEMIRQKTRYAVKIDAELLLDQTIREIEKTEVHPPRIIATKAQVSVGEDGTFEVSRISAGRTAMDLIGQTSLPNVVEIMADLLENTTPQVRLTRHTLLELIRRLHNRKPAIDNPHEFASIAARIIKDKLVEQLISGIKYEKIDDRYEMTQFSDIDSWMEHLMPANHSVYDHVIIVDSGPEKDFVNGLELREDVKLYLKLPSWFTVPTPVGDYNPDWAIVMEKRDAHGQLTGDQLLYLVRETKGKDWRTGLRPDERRKIQCGERHFKGALGVDYKVVTSANELP